YRLARESGADHRAGFEQAKKATYDSHFDYSADNRPRAMQGNVAKVVLLFKQYSQNMIYTMVRNTYQSFAGKTPTERREARRMIAGLLFSHVAAAGVLGLPMPLVTVPVAAAAMAGASGKVGAAAGLVGLAATLALAFGGDDDDPLDPEAEFRNMLADAIGQKPAEIIAKGFSRATPWDIS